MQRRMAALFLLAVGLIAWQAPLTRPTVPSSSVQATGPGEQLYPIAVSDAAPVSLPARFTESLPEAATPARPAVNWNSDEPKVNGAAPPLEACTLLLRVSRYHWARRSIGPGELAALLGGASEARSAGGTGDLGTESDLGDTRTYHLSAHDFADDDDGDGDPLDPRELRLGPPGAEVEVDCPPHSAARSDRP
jgi:hypothetical protein